MCALVTGVQTCALPIFEAMTMADKIVVMHDGKVEQIGAPLELYDHPANLFVAGVIGSPAMNFIEGRVSLNGRARLDRKSVAEGKSVTVSVDLGGGRYIKKKKNKQI